MKCPYCRSDYDPGATACSHCGAPLKESPAGWACARCGARNPAAAARCVQCAAPRVEGRRVKRGRRWRLWPLLVVAALVVVAAAAAGSLVLRSASPVTREKAEETAEQIVRESFPEFAGLAPQVSERVSESGKDSYLFSYGYTAQVDANGQVLEFPRILLIEMSKDGEEVYVSESN